MSVFCCTPQTLYLSHSLKIGYVFNRFSTNFFTKLYEKHWQIVRQTWHLNKLPWQVVLVRTSCSNVTGGLSYHVSLVRRGKFSCRRVSWFSKIIPSSSILSRFAILLISQYFFYLSCSTFSTPSQIKKTHFLNSRFHTSSQSLLDLQFYKFHVPCSLVYLFSLRFQFSHFPLVSTRFPIPLNFLTLYIISVPL